MENSVLETLLYDFAKEKTNSKQMLLINLLSHSYGKNEEITETPIYKILKDHMLANKTQICKTLLYA